MLFQARHYKAIASVLSTCPCSRHHRTTRVTLNTIEAELSKMFRWDNEKFDIDKFRSACKPISGR
jgi:hypothetical protein